MNIRKKMGRFVALIALTGMMFGCGGGSSTTSSYQQSGKLIQGPVSGATVFADKAVGGTRFVKDDNELVATTLADGSFSISVPANYGNYFLVSKGGTDKSTGLKAMQMLAPAGARNITPLTTLVALDISNSTLDPSKGVMKKIVDLMPLNGKYDDDVSVNSSPAVLMLVKSIETATKSLTDAITTTQQGKTISDDQAAYIQAQIMQALTEEMVKSTADLKVPDNVNSVLFAALEVAIPRINTVNTNIRIALTAGTKKTSALIADNSVAAAATYLSVTSMSAPLSSAGSIASEAALNGVPLVSAVTTTSVAVTQVTTIISVTTPDPSSFTTIPVISVPIVIIITGASGSTGSTGTGQQI